MNTNAKETVKPPYPRLGEVYKTLALALDTKSKNRDIERLAREGDYDWSLLSNLREELILKPLRRFVQDDDFIYNLDRFIQHVHASYLRIISTISLDSLSREDALPILIVHYFTPHAIGLFDAVWTAGGPDSSQFLAPENHPLAVVFKWADAGGGHVLAKAAFPEATGDDKINREKVTRWENGIQLPDLASLNLFLEALARNGAAEHREKVPGLRKWLLLARALSWFERAADPLNLRDIMNWRLIKGDREWDIGRILSLAAIEGGQKLAALKEPYGRLFIGLSRTTPKSEGNRKECEEALASFKHLLDRHDPEGRSRYALEWYLGRWHVLSGQYTEALEHYRQAVTLSDYRAGETWQQIIQEAMALAGYLGNEKPFLKQLKHRVIAAGLIADPRIRAEVLEDWEIDELRKQFHHLFPAQGRFIAVEQPEEGPGALPFLLYDVDELAKRQPNYRKPDQVVTVRTIDDQIRRWPQLSLYASFGPVEVVAKLLEKGASVDELDESGGSALLGAIQRAADRNEREVLDLLLSHPHSPATLNQQTVRKRLTPLIRAIDYGEPDIVSRLLDMGADANLRGHVDDQTPLYLCIRNMGGLRAASVLRQKLYVTVTSDRDLVLRETFRRYGVGVTGVFGDKKSAFDAMRDDQMGHEIFEIVVKLIIEDFLGRHTTEKQLQIAEFLLLHRANPNASHGYPTAGRTPLMLAVENDSAQAVELLMRHGGDPFLKDASGHDCRVIAAGSRSLNVIRHFRKIGVMA